MSDDGRDEDGIPNFIRMADGTLINTRTGQRSVSTEINKAFSDKPETSMLSTIAKKPPKIEGVTRRYLDDLPDGPKKSRVVAVIAAYSIFGLTDIDIAYTLGVDVEMVNAVQESQGYTKFVDAMLQNIREHDQDKIRKKINKAAEGAAEAITNLVASSKDEKVRFAAAKDVLDRTAANGDTAARSTAGSLTIRIIDDRTNPADNIKVDFDG